jgi:hypothetical protein
VISRYALCVIGFVFSAQLDTPSAQQSPVNVVTYHYDNRRTGWNQNETVLTTNNRQRPLEIGNRPTKEREAIDFRVSLAFEDDLRDGGVDNANRQLAYRRKKDGRIDEALK